MSASHLGVGGSVSRGRQAGSRWASGWVGRQAESNHLHSSSIDYSVCIIFFKKLTLVHINFHRLVKFTVTPVESASLQNIQIYIFFTKMNPYSDIYNQNNVRQLHFGPRQPYGQRPVGGFDQFRPRQMRPRFDAVSPGQFGMSPRFSERGSSQTYQPRAVYNYQTSQAQHPSSLSFVNGQSGKSSFG